MKIISGTLIVAAVCATGAAYAEGSAAPAFPPAAEVEALGLMPAGSTAAPNAAPSPVAPPAPAAVAAPQPQMQPSPALQFPPPVANQNQPQYPYQPPHPAMMQQQPAYPYNYGGYPMYPMGNPYAVQQPMPGPRQQMPAKKKVIKPWGDTRYIWPDFYTDTTGDMWDKMMNAPSDMGYMPGGWRFPSLSTPDPVTVSDAITNQFPPIMEEVPNFVNFTK